MFIPPPLFALNSFLNPNTPHPVPEIEHFFLLQVDGMDDAEAAKKFGRKVETMEPGNISSKKILVIWDSSHDQAGVNTNTKNTR